MAATQPNCEQHDIMKEIKFILERLAALEILIQNLYAKFYLEIYDDSIDKARKSLNNTEKNKFSIFSNIGNLSEHERQNISNLLIDFFANNVSILSNIMSDKSFNNKTNSFHDEDWFQALCSIFGANQCDVSQIDQVENASDSVFRVWINKQQGMKIPSSVIVKQLGQNQVRNIIADACNLFGREHLFYSKFSQENSIKCPKYFYLSPENSILILEDQGKYITGDQEYGYCFEEAKSVIDQICDFHLYWIQNFEKLKSFNIPKSNDPKMAQALPELVANAWRLTQSSLSVNSPFDPSEIVGILISEISNLMNILSQSPLTLLHGDLRMENLLFEEDQLMSVIDWQLLTIGSPMIDVAYFLTQSGDPEVRVQAENYSLNKYFKSLQKYGYSQKRINNEYYSATLFGLIIPILGASWDLQQSDKPRELVIRAFNRCLNALSSHGKYISQNYLSFEL